MSAVVEKMTRPQAMAFCRANYGYWSGPKVQSYLAERGIVVSAPTVRTWADEDVAKRYRESHAKRLRKKRAAERERRAFARIQALHERGLSLVDIAVVLTVDSGTQVDPDRVRYALKAGHLSPSLAKAIAS